MSVLRVIFEINRIYNECNSFALASIRKIVCMTILIVSSSTGMAEIIFQDDFDNHSDWQVSDGSEECNGIVGCDTVVPTNWTYLRNQEIWPRSSGGEPSQQISSTQFRGASGKSWIRTHESAKMPVTDGNTWSDDSILLKSLNNDYDEVFTSFWIKFDPDWEWASQHTGIFKLFRIYHFDGPAGEAEPWNFFSDGDSAPIFLYDVKKSPRWGVRGVYALRCDPQESEYYCKGNKEGDKLFTNTAADTPFEVILGDDKWHHFEFRVKMNTVLESADGILQVWIDGTLQFDFSNIAWRKPGSSAGIGWNMIGIGGNTTNWFSSPVNKAEQWYAIDDLVVSTTRAGMQSAPVAPSNFGVN